MASAALSLDRANRCQFDLWQLCRYRADTRVLVLRADRGWLGLLIGDAHFRFHTPIYVCLPQLLRGARFSMVPPDGTAIPEESAFRSSPCQVYIITETGTFCVGCESVSFGGKESP